MGTTRLYGTVQLVFRQHRGAVRPAVYLSERIV